MSAKLDIAVAVEGGAGRDVLLRMLPPDGPLRVASVLRMDPSALPEADGTRLDAIVAVCGEPGPTAMAFVAAAKRARPWLPVVVACPPSDGAALRGLVAAGADDLVPLLDDPEDDRACAARLSFAIEKARAVRGGAGEQAAPPAELVTVLGPKGGVGKTLTACNAAVALAQAGRRVVVVDLDLQYGDVGLALGLAPERTLHDLALAGGTIDVDLLDEHLVEHESGVRVLVAPVGPEQAGAITAELVRDVLRTLRRMCDVVVVDTAPGLAPEAIASVEDSSALWVVAGMDALGLKTTRLALDALDGLRRPVERQHLVLNRADADAGVTLSDVVAILGREPDVLVPGHRDVVRAVNAGRPIVMSDPGCAASQAFTALAATCRATEPDAGSAPVPRRRRRLRRGSAKLAVGV